MSKPVLIYSDNGTNFVRASNELKELETLMKSDINNSSIKVANSMSKVGITWHFNPPAASFFDG